MHRSIRRDFLQFFDQAKIIFQASNFMKCIMLKMIFSMKHSTVFFLKKMSGILWSNWNSSLFSSIANIFVFGLRDGCLYSSCFVTVWLIFTPKHVHFYSKGTTKNIARNSYQKWKKINQPWYFFNLYFHFARTPNHLTTECMNRAMKAFYCNSIS